MQAELRKSRRYQADGDVPKVNRGDYWGIVKGVIQPPLPAEWDS